MTTDGLQWCRCTGNDIRPSNAVIAGFENTGEELYLARCLIGGGIHVGKAGRHMKPEGAHVGYGGIERVETDYEVLTAASPNSVVWVDVAGKCSVPGYQPVVAGREKDGRELYCAQAVYDGSVQPGKSGRHMDGCSIAYGGREKTIPYYKVLCYTP
ncbi:hypothetical protein SeMB42_g04005 [Synchytrium endobioticum]|uniref:DUF3421 domain-containing protein n=1 Tax=Synchytrium endobioticum TaxID=286115 RepID=A0A507D1S4_9FUNG|nr:hypothetical protein SeLEV6574_g04392 [Synchytrium endobioticum]TPX45449.1 hypothetical protein SeMB42_g04005 [Synchytrium endobioticum]